jgi:hypothetical protein
VTARVAEGSAGPSRARVSRRAPACCATLTLTLTLTRPLTVSLIQSHHVRRRLPCVRRLSLATSPLLLPFTCCVSPSDVVCSFSHLSSPQIRRVRLTPHGGVHHALPVLDTSFGIPKQLTNGRLLPTSQRPPPQVGVVHLMRQKSTLPDPFTRRRNQPRRVLVVQELPVAMVRWSVVTW